jgi:putative SOS response-associated peptidase YedK
LAAIYLIPLGVLKLIRLTLHHLFTYKTEPKCELAQFGLVPHWAADIKKFGLRTYNARYETVAEKPSYRAAWKERRFGLALMQSFY